jgi:hypothetical protein
MTLNYLYKYESINILSLRNLKNAQIFFNAPINFNDPFEVSGSISTNKTQYKKILSHYQKNADTNNAPTKETIDAVLKKDFENEQKKFLHNNGCYCLSKINNNILMWSHYADKHKGMCLEFKTSAMPTQIVEKMREVKYSNKQPTICPMCVILDCKCSDPLAPLYTKFKDWKYEQEVRMFHTDSNTLYGYGVEALEAVYFGVKTDETDRENVCLILKGQNKNIKFYKGEMGRNSYTVSFKEVFYTPYAELKN